MLKPGDITVSLSTPQRVKGYIDGETKLVLRILDNTSDVKEKLKICPLIKDAIKIAGKSADIKALSLSTTVLNETINIVGEPDWRELMTKWQATKLPRLYESLRMTRDDLLEVRV